MDVNKKVKILYLTTTSKLFGAEKMLYELASRLDKNKYEVMVCTLKDDLGNQLLDRLRKQGIKTNCLHLDRKWKFWRVFGLFGIVRRFKPDILQTFLFFDNILGRIVGKMLGVPVVISGQRNARQNRSVTREIIDKCTLFLCDLIVSNSKAGKNVLIERTKAPSEKVKVIYNGIGVKEVSQKGKREILSQLSLPESLAKNFIVGFVGGLTEQKGLPYLLQALKEVDNQIVLVLIGQGEKEGSLKKLVDKYHLEDRVFFTGYKPQALQYMPLFDLFVLPSLWEGMPNVVLEAMLQELSVVSTDVGDVKKMIHQQKFLMEPGKVNDIKDKILMIKNMSEEERKELGRENREQIKENFSIGRMINNYQNLYQELAGNKL